MNSHLLSLPTRRVVGACQPLGSSSTAVWMTPLSGVDQHAMAALVTRALSVKLSSVLRTAECHSRGTLDLGFMRQRASQHVPLQSANFCSAGPFEWFSTDADGAAAFCVGPKLESPPPMVIQKFRHIKLTLSDISFIKRPC